jgi:hypothetical protein
MRSAVHPRLAFPRQADLVAGVDPCRDGDHLLA